MPTKKTLIIDNGTARHVNRGQEFLVEHPRCVVIYFRNDSKRSDAFVANIKNQRHLKRHIRDLGELVADSGLESPVTEEVYLIFGKDSYRNAASLDDVAKYLREAKIFAFPKLAITYQDEFRRSVTSYGVF